MIDNNRRCSFAFHSLTVPPVDSESTGQPCLQEVLIFEMSILNRSKSDVAGTQTEHLRPSKQGYYFPRKFLEVATQLGRSNHEREFNAEYLHGKEVERCNYTVNYASVHRCLQSLFTKHSSTDTCVLICIQLTLQGSV